MNVNSGLVNHLRLKKGLHLFDILYPNSIRPLYVYDLRFKDPVFSEEQQSEVLGSRTIHTIEHLLAHFLRNGSSDNDTTVSIFPYGCKTGFGVISELPPLKFLDKLKEGIQLSLESDKIPFATPIQCGNWCWTSLEGAKKEMSDFLNLIENIIQDDIVNVPRIDDSCVEDINKSIEIMR